MAFYEIVATARTEQDDELADQLEGLGNPDAVIIDEITKGSDSLREWLKDRKNSRAIPHRMEAAGYIRVPNPDNKDKVWKVGGERKVVYARKDLPEKERLAAAYALAQRRPAGMPF